MKHLLIFSALLTSVVCSTANAAEKEISFLNIPQDRIGLARNLLLSDSASKGELKEWNIVIDRDVKFADLSLNDGKNSQITLFITNKNYCSHYGCTLQIWEFKNGKWIKILGTIAEKLFVQDEWIPSINRAQANLYRRKMDRTEAVSIYLEWKKV